MNSHSNNPHNRLRQLKGLVTIDAWHEWNPQSATATLHAYVNFDTARLGGEAHDEVAFRLQLRNAEIKLLQSEPKSYDIDPKRVWRGNRDSFGRLSKKIGKSSEANKKIGVGSSLTTGDGVGVSLSLDRSVSTSEVEEIVIEREGAISAINVSFIRNSKDQPVWVLRPSSIAQMNMDSAILMGQPWDDKLQQLVTMKADRRMADQELLSSLKLCVQCRSEDLLFFDMRVKNKNGVLEEIEFSSPKRIVIQEYLKQALISEGLPAGDMSSPFSIVILGEAVSEPRLESDDE